MDNAGARDVVPCLLPHKTVTIEKPNDPTVATSKLADPVEELTYVNTGVQNPPKHTRVVDDDEPLIDTTAVLQLRSKKTERGKKRSQKKQLKAAERPSLLNLPPELLQEVLGHLRASDIFQLFRVNHNVRDFILENESNISRNIIRRRYWILAQCFPLPVAFQNVDSSSHPSLLNEKRQDMLQIHKKPYSHVRGIDPLKICTCMSCVFAWNNLCLVLDLSHWQANLNQREPIPMIARGTAPDWNQNLLDDNAAIVEKAMDSPLCHAAILEKHLRTTVQTIFRTFRGKKTVHPKRLYHLTPPEADRETDEFLERSGPPSYEFPWHRDNYYSLEAYVPNRKWSKEQERWLYYAEGQHERELQWMKERFTPDVAREKALDAWVENFKKRMAI